MKRRKIKTIACVSLVVIRFFIAMAILNKKKCEIDGHKVYRVCIDLMGLDCNHEDEE